MTSIATRVDSAMAHYEKAEVEESFYDICSAIEATSKREGNPKGREGYKKFLRDNLQVICKIGLGVGISGLKFQVPRPIGDLPVDENGEASIEGVIYHLVRCGLYHSAGIDDSLTITKREIGCGDGRILIPEMIAIGLVVAVVLSPANASERLRVNRWIECGGERYLISEMWGKRDELSPRIIAS